jgi:hypothetical protein
MSNAVRLFLDPGFGVNLPQMFVEMANLAAFTGVDPAVYEVLRKGPDADPGEGLGYWDAWAYVLVNAAYVEDGWRFGLSHDLDKGLFLICHELMTEAEKSALA